MTTPLTRERAKLQRQQAALEATEAELNNLAQAPAGNPALTAMRANLLTKARRQRAIIDQTSAYILFLEDSETDPNQMEIETPKKKK